MPPGFAARLGDATAHGNPLSPGPGSLNVRIGKKPAWRGISYAQFVELIELVDEILEVINKGKPLKAVDIILEELPSLLQSFAADIHACTVMKAVIPDGTGVVTTGSKTVFINGLAACRIGDTIQEATSVNFITAGCWTVKIGG